MPENMNSIILDRDHADMLDRFLLPRAENSLILLSNSRAAGLVDRGAILQGTYAAFIADGEITGVAAHYWNGMIFLQAPDDPFALVSAALAASGRECTGITGPYEQVQNVLRGFLKTRPHPSFNSRDLLLSLDLDTLITPELLHGGGMTCRKPSDDEVPALVAMRIAFMQEHLGRALPPAMEREARNLVAWQQQTGNHWILETGGTIVATTAVSTGINGMVQVGGVFTLPEFRNRGFGRAVVAGSLLSLREHGVKRAILFTGQDMPAARRIYAALGFRQIGEYGLVIF